MANGDGLLGEYRLTSVSAPYARRGLDDCLRSLGWEDDPRYDVMVALSEVATNAVRHAGGDFSVTALVYPDRVLVSVYDHSSVPPRLRQPSENGGIGLRLVDRLSSDWSWSSAEDGRGKVVRFTVQRRVPATS